MTKVLHRANSRGFADHGWLKSSHTFSFANYFNPERMNFGALRVLNDDLVAPGMGFPTHPHADMEIISIPLKGSLAHRDSQGNAEIIRSGDVQIMSAGTGIAHSEFNPDKTQEVNFLQIWILPEQRGIAPRYEQRTFDLEKSRNSFVRVVSWKKEDDAVWINQRAQFWQGIFDAGVRATLKADDPENGIYVFLIEGEAVLAGERLGKRDAIGVSGGFIEIETTSSARILVIEVPLAVI